MRSFCRCCASNFRHALAELLLALSNCRNSGIDQVGVLTQYRPRSLNDHLGIGRPWGLDSEDGGHRRSIMPSMRSAPKAEEARGGWMADPGDDITHVNGYAVNSVEDLICAVSVAKNKDDVQLVIKDVTTGKLTVFYVTATKR